MAATITANTNPVLVTATDTADSQVNLDALIEENEAIAEIRKITGTSLKFNPKNTIGTNPAVFLPTDIPAGTGLRLNVRKGFNFHYRATAGSETFIINVIKGTA